MKVSTYKSLRIPPKLKNIGGLTSCGVGARWCLGQSPASFWVGRPSGWCPLATRAHPSWSAQTRRATRDRPSWSSLARRSPAQVPQGLSVKGHTTTRNACLSFKRHTGQLLSEGNADQRARSLCAWANEEARAMAISPRPPEGVRGPFTLQQEPVGEVGDDRYQPAAHANRLKVGEKHEHHHHPRRDCE